MVIGAAEPCGSARSAAKPSRASNHYPGRSGVGASFRQATIRGDRTFVIAPGGQSLWIVMPWQCVA
jgi:hypothetical protein